MIALKAYNNSNVQVLVIRAMLVEEIQKLEGHGKLNDIDSSGSVPRPLPNKPCELLYLILRWHVTSCNFVLFFLVFPWFSPPLH